MTQRFSQRPDQHPSMPLTQMRHHRLEQHTRLVNSQLHTPNPTQRGLSCGGPLGDLLISVNRVLRGWCNYFRHGVSARTFSYLDHYTWWRIFGWLRKRHAGLNKGTLVRRHLPGWEMRDGHIEMFRPQQIAIVRYRYRGTQIPTPWANETQESPAPAA